jgi:hypothetical protein
MGKAEFSDLESSFAKRLVIILNLELIVYVISIIFVERLYTKKIKINLSEIYWKKIAEKVKLKLWAG